MDEWKKLICRGNRSYENGRLEDARLLYRAALDQAERSLARCGDRGGLCTYADALAAVAAVVVTEHNLADLCLRCDQVEDAGAHLLAAHERVTRIMDDRTLPWTLRAAAMRNCGQARLAMLSFASEHGGLHAPSPIDGRITHLPASPLLH